MNNLPIDEIFGKKNVKGEPVGRILLKPVRVQRALNGFTISDFDQQKDPPQHGEVIMVSKEATHLNIGDIVLHSRHYDQSFDHDGQQYIIIESDQAFAKMKKDNITIVKCT